MLWRAARLQTAFPLTLTTQTSGGFEAESSSELRTVPLDLPSARSSNADWRARGGVAESCSQTFTLKLHFHVFNQSNALPPPLCGHWSARFGSWMEAGSVGTGSGANRFYTFHWVLLHEANNEEVRRARLTPPSEVSMAQRLQHEADKAIPHTADRRNSRRESIRRVPDLQCNKNVFGLMKLWFKEENTNLLAPTFSQVKF